MREEREDCTDAEKIIWDLVRVDCGDFIGINALTYDQKSILRHRRGEEIESAYHLMSEDRA